MLMPALNTVEPAVFDQPGAGLLEMKGDACLAALLPQVQNPAEITGPGIAAAFSPRRESLDAGSKAAVKMDVGKQRLANNFFVQGGSARSAGSRRSASC